MDLKNAPETTSVYRSIALLSGVLHLFYVFLFAMMGCTALVIYNIFSVGIYMLAIYFVRRGWNRACITMAHLEVCVFVILAVLMTGWSFGFQLLLVCTASLVYFCPYHNWFTPYINSIIEAFLFITLRLITKYADFVPLMEEGISRFELPFYLTNTLSAFFLILFSAYRANLSSSTLQHQLMEENRDLSQMATHDSLTGLWVRRVASQKLLELWKECLKGGTQFTVVMGDIDDFKSVNDTFGHDAGDTVLRQIAALFPPKNAYRWGGEEFLLIFPGQDKGAALNCIEDLCRQIYGLTFHFDGRVMHTSMTFGLADSTEGSSVKEIISLADRRLYKGKQAGKNQVTA